MGSLSVLRLIGMVWVVASAFTALYIYPPRGAWGIATTLLFGIAPLLAFVVSRYRAKFNIQTDNIYLTASYLSLSFIVFEFMVLVLALGFMPYWGDMVYIVSVLVAIALVGLLNEDIAENYVLVLEPEHITNATRGAALGSVMFFIALGLAASFNASNVMIGYLSTKLLEVTDIVPILLLMIFFVAIPEEFLARVFYIGMGSATVGAPLSSLLMIATWYALHAVTRYFADPSGIVLFIITLGGVFLMISYMYYSYLTAVFAHAIYNTLIYTYFMIGSAATFVVAVCLIALHVVVSRAMGVRVV